MGSTTGAAENRNTSARLGRDRLFDRANLVLLPILVILLVARQHGMIARQSPWLLFLSLIAAYLSGVLFAARFPPGSSRSKPRVFLVLTLGLGGVFLYATGWGAVLAVTFIASSSVVIEADGSRYGPTAIVTTLVTILGGEIAVALGLFPSKISEPTGHGLAALEAAVTVTVIALLARGQRDKELAEEHQLQCEERFRALVQYASDAILVIEDGGAVKYASPAVEHLLGCAPEELTSFDVTWVDADHADAIIDLFRRLKARPGAVEVAEVPIRRGDGTSKWVEVHLTNLIDTASVGGFVCNMRDVGARREVHLQLVHEAQHDPLTHVANRRLFLERLDHAWRGVTTSDEVIAVLFIDVDHFKAINDGLGHEVGDHVLVAIASRAVDAASPDRPGRAVRRRRVRRVAGPDAGPRRCVRSRRADSSRALRPETSRRPRAERCRECRCGDVARREERGRAPAPLRPGDVLRQAQRARALRVVRPREPEPDHESGRARAGREPVATGEPTDRYRSQNRSRP